MAFSCDKNIWRLLPISRDYVIERKFGKKENNYVAKLAIVTKVEPSKNESPAIQNLGENKSKWNASGCLYTIVYNPLSPSNKCNCGIIERSVVQRFMIYFSHCGQIFLALGKLYTLNKRLYTWG